MASTLLYISLAVFCFTQLFISAAVAVDASSVLQTATSAAQAVTGGQLFSCSASGSSIQLLQALDVLQIVSGLATGLLSTVLGILSGLLPIIPLLGPLAASLIASLALPTLVSSLVNTLVSIPVSLVSAVVGAVFCILSQAGNLLSVVTNLGNVVNIAGSVQ